MPLSTNIVGARSGPIQCDLDRRWAMNYAASIDDRSDVLYDTRKGPIPVHPMFLAHPEWESQKQLRELTCLDANEQSRAVQVTHDSQLYRPLTSGMVLTTEATVIGVERRRAGAWSTVRYTTTSEGELIASTTVAALYRGVEVDGDDRPAPPQSPLDAPEGDKGEQVVEVLDLPSTACHLYSECARIWNPIHTDLGIAAAAGLPGLILHGTATLAKAVSAITRKLTGGSPENITRISGRFQAMVIVPTSLTLTFQTQTLDASGKQRVMFTVLTPSGDQAITGGIVEFKTNELRNQDRAEK